MKTTNYYSLLAFIALLTLSTLTCFANENSKKYDSIYFSARKIQRNSPGAAISQFLKCLPYYEESKDTLKYIKTKMCLIKDYSFTGQYHLAFEHAWSTLPIIQNDTYAEQRVAIYRELSSLYIIFERYEKASYYLDNSIYTANKFITDSIAKSNNLGRLYSRKAWLISSWHKNYETAEKLIFKSLKHFNSIGYEKAIIYKNMQLAENYSLSNQFYKSDSLFNLVKHEAPKINPLIFSVLHVNIGRHKIKKGDIDSAIYYLEKSIFDINARNIHIDMKAEVLELLSDCYSSKNNTAKAYKYLKSAKNIEDSVFNGKSQQNKYLFKIIDKHSTQLKEKEAKINSQKLDLLERKRETWLLKLALLLIILSTIIVFLIAYAKKLTKKHKIEQELTKQKQFLEEQKQKELLEAKNKELLTFSLQFVERNSLLENIQKKLLELDLDGNNKKSVKNLVQSLGSTKTKKWKEFDMYFSSVNKLFYSSLKYNHPQLTSTDLKMCALLILGFCSKDMAQIMGIGADSINTSRSRIRKKLNLTRDINLVDFLLKETNKSIHAS